MPYIYDIVLNFNQEFYEFYEWKRDDLIYHIKKINLFFVDSKVYNEIFDNIVVFNNDFLLSIFNKCEFCTNHRICNIPYAFLLTDSYRVVALMLNKNGRIIKYSSLMLDEEEEILNLCHKYSLMKLDYRIIELRIKNEFQTREEKNIIKYIKRELEKDYEKKNINKLKYLYYEYFNKQNDNIDLIYQELLAELSKDINIRHYNLCNLIKLSYSGKNALN